MATILTAIGIFIIPYLVGRFTILVLKIDFNTDFGNSWYLGLIVLGLIGIIHLILNIFFNLIV